jgi:hypothetical protein
MLNRLPNLVIPRPVTRQRINRKNIALIGSDLTLNCSGAVFDQRVSLTSGSYLTLIVQTMKGPYENVLLGAFIFRLGYKMGESGKLQNTPFAANLFQQTPLDTAFSDFMCASKAKGFLLEFKKNWEGRVSERVKEKYKLLQEQPTLIAQGEKCHLLGYGKDIEHSQGRGDIDILFGNYLEIVSAEREEELKVWSMNYFLQEIIDERIGANSEEFRDYISNFLKHLEQRHRANTSSKRLFANKKIGALASATGAVAIMNTGSALYAVPLFSIIELGVNLKISQAEKLSQEIEPPSFRFRHDEHSRGIDMEYFRAFEPEKRSRGIDMDRDI